MCTEFQRGGFKSLKTHLFSTSNLMPMMRRGLFLELAAPEECVRKTESLHHFPSKKKKITFNIVIEEATGMLFSLCCVCAAEMVSLCLHL